MRHTLIFIRAGVNTFIYTHVASHVAEFLLTLDASFFRRAQPGAMHGAARQQHHHATTITTSPASKPQHHSYSEDN